MLLGDILENPAIAHYPTKLVIGRCVHELSDLPNWSEERREEGKWEVCGAITQSIGFLIPGLKTCLYIRRSDKQKWLVDLCARGEHTALALLLTVLPSLQSITINDGGFNLDRLEGIVSSLAAAHLKDPESFHPPPFLTTGRLYRCAIFYNAN